MRFWPAIRACLVIYGCFLGWLWNPAGLMHSEYTYTEADMRAFIEGTYRYDFSDHPSLLVRIRADDVGYDVQMRGRGMSRMGVVMETTGPDHTQLATGIFDVFGFTWQGAQLGFNVTGQFDVSFDSAGRVERMSTAGSRFTKL